MRALIMALALTLVAGTAQAQTPSRDSSRPSQGGLGYGGGADGTSGYRYSGDKGSGLHYGGGYIRSDGTVAVPQGSHGTQTGPSSTRSTLDPSGGLTGSRPRY